MIIFDVDHDISLEIKAAVQEDSLKVVGKQEFLKLSERVVVVLAEK